MVASQPRSWSKFTCFRGDTKRLRFNLTDETGAAFNPTGYALIFSVKASADDPDLAAKVQKASAVGGFYTIDAAAGIVEVELVPADDDALAPGTPYECDVQAQSAASGAVKTVGRGTLTLAKDVSRGTTLAIATTTTNPEDGYNWANIRDNPGTFSPSAHAASHAAAGGDPVALSKAQVGLGNVDNTSDAAKPVSTAQAAADAAVGSAAAGALAAHASLSNNPHAVTKAQVGLGNADNTSDANKPVSSAMQAALDLKLTISTDVMGYLEFLYLQGQVDF